MWRYSLGMASGIYNSFRQRLGEASASAVDQYVLERKARYAAEDASYRARMFLLKVALLGLTAAFVFQLHAGA